MLDVVQDEQEATPAHGGVEGHPQGAAAPLADPQRRSDGRDDQLWVAQRRQRDEGGAGGAGEEVVGHGVDDRQRQAALADAARPGQRQQPVAARQVGGHRRHISLTADQRRRRRREGGVRLRRSGHRLAGAAAGGQQGVARVGGQAERLGQGADGRRVGTPPVTTLQRADALGGQPGPFGELLLRQPGRLAQAPQPRAEVDHLRVGHATPPPRRHDARRPIVPPATGADQHAGAAVWARPAVTRRLWKQLCRAL